MQGVQLLHGPGKLINNLDSLWPRQETTCRTKDKVACSWSKGVGVASRGGLQRETGGGAHAGREALLCELAFSQEVPHDRGVLHAAYVVNSMWSTSA